MFDTSDSLFDFEPLVPPDLLAEKLSPQRVEDEFDADDFLDFNAPVLPSLAKPTMASGQARDSPPPDLDEEPEGWEEEMMAMREMEEDEGLARTRKALDAPLASLAPRGPQKAAGTGRPEVVVDGFGDADMFDFDVQPEASCESRSCLLFFRSAAALSEQHPGFPLSDLLCRPLG